MKVQDIMTKNPSCCTPEMSLDKVARLMLDCDCGEIPVLGGQSSGMPVGVVTDRDITCRTIAQGKNPLDMCAREIMSSPVVTVPLDADLQECCNLMAQAQVRRIPVIDSSGRCCGIISEADIARRAAEHDIAHILRDISQPTQVPSRVSNLVS